MMVQMAHVACQGLLGRSAQKAGLPCKDFWVRLVQIAHLNGQDLEERTWPAQRTDVHLFYRDTWGSLDQIVHLSCRDLRKKLVEIADAHLLCPRSLGRKAQIADWHRGWKDLWQRWVQMSDVLACQGLWGNPVHTIDLR